MSALDQLLHQIATPTELAWNEETYDLALASGLSQAERSTFIAKLIDHARRGDPRAVLTLGHIHAIETLPALQALARTADPLAPAARRAMVLLGHGAEIVEVIADDAVRAPAMMSRVAAVLDLTTIGGATAIAALEHALEDVDSTIRLLAWDGLVAVLALGPLLKSPEGNRELTTDVEVFRVLLGSDLPAFVRLGVARMRALTTRLAAGATPQALGIGWAPNPAPEVLTALRRALFDADVAFPVDEIAALTGVPRRLAETMIALRLEDHDARVPDALVRLAATWTTPALEELARSSATPDALREASTRAVIAMQAS